VGEQLKWVGETSLLPHQEKPLGYIAVIVAVFSLFGIL